MRKNMHMNQRAESPWVHTKRPSTPNTRVGTVQSFTESASQHTSIAASMQPKKPTIIHAVAVARWFRDA